ncbi:hypothetical protein [Streptomyces sp. NPDC002889]|uniref:hypothetical protein n=1 Tax=Streptomyces sp. NPDC002889 TaxID=3364669 RepID=UPI0036B4102F
MRARRRRPTFAVLVTEQVEVAGRGGHAPQIALRCAEFGLLAGGAYCVVRGRWRG